MEARDILGARVTGSCELPNKELKLGLNARAVSTLNTEVLFYFIFLGLVHIYDM